MSKTFTVSDVASHNKPDDLYIIVDGDVFDVTKFQDDHPGVYSLVFPCIPLPGFNYCVLCEMLISFNVGGKKILQRVAGKDASKQFWKYHNEGILKKYQAKLHVGSLDTKPKPAPKAEPTPEPSPKTVAATQKEVSNNHDESEALEPFGQQIPFADPAWYQSVSDYTFLLLSYFKIKN